MTQEFGFLVKVFSQEKYRDDFLDGKLYMNPIKFFKEYEEEAKNNIGDQNEAVTAWLPPNDVRLVFRFSETEPLTIEGKDLVAPVVIRTNRHDNYNVLCLTMLHSHGIDINHVVNDEQIKLLEGYFNLPSEAVNLGKYAVVIPDLPRFISYIEKAAVALIENNCANSFIADKVIYYDKANALSLAKQDSAVFHKQKEYEHQSEYRLCLDRGTDKAEAYIFDVGSIRDLAFPCLTSEVNSHFKLEITEQ